MGPIVPASLGDLFHKTVSTGDIGGSGVRSGSGGGRATAEKQKASTMRG